MKLWILHYWDLLRATLSGEYKESQKARERLNREYTFEEKLERMNHLREKYRQEEEDE